MKNVTIVALVLILLGLGGWLVTNHANKSSNSTTKVSSSKTTDSGSTLDYSNKGLSKVSADIYNQISTTELILSHNDLTSLPSQMGGMTNLQVLKVDHNQLEGALIAEIRKMPLVTLDASYNKMTGVPAEIGQIKTLKTLDYSYNNINALPNEIANLKQLKQLNLTGNPLSQAQISKLKSELPNTNIVF